MQIVTGYEGTPHVTAWQDRDLNQGIFGATDSAYVLETGSKLAATIVSNNEVRIADGAVVWQGCLGVIQKGTYDTLSISNGTQGMQRIDLIALQYTKNSGTGVEALDLVVIEGTPSSGTPTAPMHTSGDIQNGATLAQVGLYQVNINGLTIESVTNHMTDSPSLRNLNAQVSALNNTVGTLYGGDYENISLPNASDTVLASISVPAGTYVVYAGINFGNVSSGKTIELHITPDMGVAGLFRSTTSSRPSVLRGCAVVTFTSAGTISVSGYQNSGSAITVTRVSVTAVRIMSR